MKNDERQIVLATQSKSRVELIKQNNLNWLCVKNKFDEESFKVNLLATPSITNLENYSKILSEQKGLSVVNDYKDSIIIGCDTVIFCKGKLLEKPKSMADAKKMLEFLQNVPQYAITGVTLIDTKTLKRVIISEITKLIFSTFDDKQWHFLLEQNNPLNNAGGYTLDKELDRSTTIIHGSKDNVIGIPIKKIQKFLNTI